MYVAIYICRSIIAHDYILIFLDEKWCMETAKYVYKCFFLKLVQTLPMSDVIFLALLFRHDLFPGNLREEVLAKPTRADRAEHFLTNAIEHYLFAEEDFMPFRHLLEVMSLCNHAPLKNLAAEINQRLGVQTVTICDKVPGEGEECKAVI